jgi:hypothetical protein
VPQRRGTAEDRQGARQRPGTLTKLADSSQHRLGDPLRPESYHLSSGPSRSPVHTGQARSCSQTGAELGSLPAGSRAALLHMADFFRTPAGS